MGIHARPIAPGDGAVLATTPRRFRLPLAIAVAAALFAAGVDPDLVGADAALWINDLAPVAAALLAAGLCARAAIRQTGRMRVFWWLFAATAAGWAAGDGVWVFYELVRGAEVPAVSAADVAYLAVLPLPVVALLIHPFAPGTGAGKARSVLDGLAVAVALLLVSWIALLGPTWRDGDLSSLTTVVTLAYPLGDVVVLFCVVLAVRRLPAVGRAPLVCLLGGMAAVSLADSGYAYLTQTSDYAGGLVDTGWVAGYLAIGLAAHWSREPVVAPAAPDAPRRPSLAPVFASFVPVLAALALVGLKIRITGEMDAEAVAMAFALTAIVLTRQAIVFTEIAVTARRGGRWVELL